MDKRNLNSALETFLKENAVNQLAKILTYASKKGRISYEEAEHILDDDPEDALLLADQQRLLIPLRSVKDTLEWDHSVLLLKPGEIYKMPNVVRYLVEQASRTGQWNPEYAVAQIFREMGEPSWNTMPALVKKLGEEASYNKLNAVQIKQVCSQLGLGDRVDSLIAELKGAGVMSPKLSSIVEVHRAGSPIYEINPSLFMSTSGNATST